MHPEYIVCAVGIVVILYFWLKPRRAPKPEDNLTNEIKVNGLPPNDGGNII